MRGVFEFTGFAGLALALHVAAFQSLPQGTESAGSGGDALLTVAAVSGALSDMVALWDSPPGVSEVMPAAMVPILGDPLTGPDVPVPEAMPGRLSQVPPSLIPALPAPESLPTQEMTRAAPMPAAPFAEAPPHIRPRSRPEAAGAAPRPTAKPVPVQSARAASTAAGAGAASARGTSGPAETASLTKVARQTLMAEWGGKIRNRIDRSKPRGAGRGSVTVVLTVARDGALQSVVVGTSSGQAALDQRAVQAVRSAGRLPAAPAGLSDATYTFRLPIRFD